ncbi:Uncharacterised protein [Serratia rubidaea]|uniref:Uncharacterized protein n=1 Tax=Serratia rubidaea TaxID=61652 RepID=A0A3S4FXH1_SERRU|nr:Uncharacterised protein [Serratia rubidaea]
MRRKSQKLSGRAFIRYQRRLIGLTVAAAMMLPLTAGVVVMLMPRRRRWITGTSRGQRRAARARRAE